MIERGVNFSLKKIAPNTSPKIFSKLKIIETLVGFSVFCAIVCNKKQIPEQTIPRYNTPPTAPIFHSIAPGFSIVNVNTQAKTAHTTN